MRKMMLLAALVAIAALMLAAAPALARDNDRHDNDRNNNHHNRFFDNDDDLRFVFFDDNDDDIRFVFFDDDDDFCDFFDCDNDNFRHNRFFDDDDFFDNDVEQDAESGDVDQSFVVTNTGDNSNQCVGTQGVANTGNAQNQLGFTTFGDGFNNDFDRDHFNNDFDRDHFFRDFDRDHFNNGDLELNDVGSSIDVSPTNTTRCDQQVNQAAAASAPHHWVWTASGWMWV